MKPIRVQSNQWHSIKDNLRATNYYISDNNRIKGIYRDPEGKVYSHWLNNEEIIELLNKIMNKYKDISN